MAKGILVAGSIIVDNIYTVEQYPQSGQLEKINNIDKSVGGLVSNVSIDLKRLDKELPVFACGKISLDENGKFALDTLNKEGVDTSNINVCAVKTSFTEVISVCNGQRTFFAYPGACDLFSFNDINFDKVNPKMLHLGYFLLLDKIDSGDGEKILKSAKEHNILTSIDLVSENSDRYDLVKPCLKYVDNLIINDIEASMITSIPFNAQNIEKIMQKLRNFGVIDRIIVHSSNVSYMLRNGKIYEQKSMNIPSEMIKGTTGAGDAFASGVLYGIYNDFNNEKMLNFATKVAAISLFASDATSALKSAKEIEEYF